MNGKPSKLQLLTGLLSMLHLREKTLKDPALIQNNNEFSQSIKKSFLRINRDFLEFIYCYLFNHFTELSKGSFYLNGDGSISINSLSKDSIGKKYLSDRYELIEDQALPIKRTRRTIRDNKDSSIKISNEITYYNSKSIEMIKMISKEESASPDLPVNELLQQAESIPRDVVIFRTEDDITEIKEMSKSGNHPYGVKRYNNDLKNIWDINPTDNAAPISGEELEFDYEVMPSIVYEYFKDLQKKSIEKAHDYEPKEDYYDNRLIDEDILRMLDKIESNVEHPLEGEEYKPSRMK